MYNSFRGITTKVMGEVVEIVSKTRAKKNEDPQKWLDEQYPTPESKAKVEKLDIEINTYRSLSLSGFINLTELHCDGIIVINNLDLTDCSKLKILTCSVVGDLKLNCPDLEELVCNGGYTANLDFLTMLSPEKLRVLDIGHNNFSYSDLSGFSSFINLEVLKIGGYSSRWGIPTPNYKFFNRFYGSIEPLKNLTKLKKLNIDCTDIDSGLEYLPESLEKFSYSLEGWDNSEKQTIERKDAKVKKIIEELAPYNGDWKEWQANHQELVIKANPQRILKKIQDLETKKQEFQKEIDQLQQEYYLAQGKSTSLQEQTAQLEKEINLKVEEIVQLQTEINKKTKDIEIFQGKEQLIDKLREDLKELKTRLTTKEVEFEKLKEQYKQLVKQCEFYLKMINLYKEKQKEAEDLKETIKQGNLSLMEQFSESQKGVGKLEGKLETIIKEQNLTKKDLLSKLELRNSQWDEVVTQLGVQTKQNITIEEFKEWLEEKLTSMNTVINVNQGNVIIGSSFGDNTNLSYQSNRLIELTNQELTTQIEIPPKS